MLGHFVRIRLEGGNDQVLHPGQVVNGVVEYKAPSGTMLNSVRIDFRGVTKILPKKNASHINIEHVELFQMGQVLQNSVIEIVDGKMQKWDFTFALPTLTGPNRSSGVYKDEGNPHFEEGVHVLPPSVEPSDVPETKIEYNMYCIASERPQAIGAHRQSAFSDKPVCAVLDHLKLRPDVETAPDPMPTVLEREVSMDAQQRRFSILSRRSSTTRNNSSATAAFVEAQVPTVIIPGKNIEILLSLRLPESHDTSASGKYVHKSTILHVESTTHRRTAKTPHNPGLDILSTTKLDMSKAISELPVKPTPAMSLKFGTNAIRSSPPTFKSYSVAREYHLTVTTVLGHNKQDFEAKWTIPVQLVHLASNEEVLTRRISNAPPPPAPLPEPRSASEPWNRRLGIEDDLPPAYEEREES